MGDECLRVHAGWMAVLMLAVLAAVFVGTAWAYGRRPAWAALSPGPEAFPLRGRDLAVYAAVFLGVLALGLWKVAPHWRMQTDEERDAFIAALCGAGRACPLVGNEMNRLRLQLGPLNRYLMAACWVLTPDPRLVLTAILVLHAAAAAWAARVADSLVGAPAGLAAGLLLGTNSALLEVYPQPSNGSWVTVFLVGTLWATLRWVRGDGGVPFVAGVSCLACATQLHGTAFVFVPVAALAAWAWRPRTPRWALAVGAGVILVTLAPWLRFQLETGWSGLRAFSASWFLTPAQGGLHGHVAAAQALPLRALAPLRSIGPLAVLVILGVPALAWGPAPTPAVRTARRALLLFLLVPLGAAMAGAAVAADYWVERYNVPYLPAAALTAAVALAAPGWLRLRLRLPHGSAWGAWGAWGVRALPWVLALPAVLALAAGGLGRANEEGSAWMRSRTELSLAESTEAVRVLGAHGFRAQDLETRVHGLAWNRWNGAQVYLGHWLLGVRGGMPPAEAVLVADCAAPAGFARWQHALTTAHRAPHVLVGYRPALGPVRLTFELGTNPWSYEPGTPFYMAQANPGDGALRARLDPALGYPEGYRTLTTRWLQATAGRTGTEADRVRARLHAVLAPGGDDRAVVVLAPAGLVPEVTVAGQPRVPEDTQTEGLEARWRTVVTAAERAAGPVAVDVVIPLERNGMPPRRLDLYEEPAVGCAGR